MSVPELQPTKLGTKQHWDDVYDEELKNFEEIGEEGEIWFGTETVEMMVEWCTENMPPSLSQKILEVGCGNGTLLLGLLDTGYSTTALYGIDYSEAAVSLAQAIAVSRSASEITYRQCDFLKDDPMHPASSIDSWDLILDKGTLDAIALGEKDNNKRSPASSYPDRVLRLLKPGGFFLITSCNFTEQELKELFCSDQLQYYSRVQHPVFTFGGRSGSAYATIAFRRTTT